MDPLESHHLEVVAHAQAMVEATKQAIVRAAPGTLVPDVRVPCFAHMRVQTERTSRDLLFGFHSFIDAEAGVTLLDWRTAPLAEVLFGYDEGEAYELELAGRIVSGTVVHKRLWSFRAGELVRIDGAESALVRSDEGVWTLVHEPLPTLSAAGKSLPRHRVALDANGRRVPVVGDLLDPEQRALLERDTRTPLLILGGAGSGKTTVALHRLASLHHREPGRFEQRRMAVVVPDPGLQRLTAAILEQLGLGAVGVYTFDDWVARQARRVFSDLPERQCDEAPAAVMKLKRHPALRDVLPFAVEKIGRAIAFRLERQFPAGERVPYGLLADRSMPPLRRLDDLEEQLRASRPRHQHGEIERAFNQERRRLFRARDDLLQVFGDQELLTQAAQRSLGGLGERSIAATLEHTRIQFSETSEQRYAHVDEESRQTVDGLDLDAGTPLEIAQTVDVEDYAVCFELLRLKTGSIESPHGKPFRFAHMVLDEAQDLAPIELGVLGRSLQPEASLTVCGDRAQHIDPSACFTGWEGALHELGVVGVAPAQLRTSYRCTEAVMHFAHAVLGEFAPAEMPVPTRAGMPVVRSTVATEAHSVYLMAQALSELLRREPTVTVAVITRTPEAARRIHAALSRSVPARLILSGLFSFTPGIDVTSVAQVKGLEFDVVIVPDVNPTGYGDDADARRKLHVACTRAIEQLWVLSVGLPSPIVPPA